MKSNKGFTLIEVILTITLMAIAAALFVTYLGTSLTGSALPPGLVRSQYNLIEQMELFNNQYRQQINNASGTLATDLATFNSTYIAPFVGAGNTTIVNMTSNGSPSYTTQNTVLIVTLRNGDQTLQTIFTR
jgi:prepilin-type N-terminal cleavage/methylation domain-containing protein